MKIFAWDFTFAEGDTIVEKVNHLLNIVFVLSKNESVVCGSNDILTSFLISAERQDNLQKSINESEHCLGSIIDLNQDKRIDLSVGKENLNEELVIDNDFILKIFNFPI